ncbi:hypothetical protein V8J88_03575 [Massilia sp. W12]|uniref:hypothetical protein n=1 Tax=Massilia sp. W12 TaxID=3126507 RepID=UPI0030D3C025
MIKPPPQPETCSTQSFARAHGMILQDFAEKISRDQKLLKICAEQKNYYFSMAYIVLWKLAHMLFHKNCEKMWKAAWRAGLARG